MMINSETINRATYKHIAKNLPIFTNYIFTFFTRVFLIGALAQLYIITHSDKNLLFLYKLLLILCFIAFVCEAALYIGNLLDSIAKKLKLITKKSCRIIAAFVILTVSIGIVIALVLFAIFVFETIGDGMSMVTITQQCKG